MFEACTCSFLADWAVDITRPAAAWTAASRLPTYPQPGRRFFYLFVGVIVARGRLAVARAAVPARCGRHGQPLRVCPQPPTGPGGSVIASFRRFVVSSFCRFLAPEGCGHVAACGRLDSRFAPAHMPTAWAAVFLSVCGGDRGSGQVGVGSSRCARSLLVCARSQRARTQAQQARTPEA